MADASTLHDDLQNLVGRVIAQRYRVDAVIGVGGMGAVFRAHHVGLRRDMALKVLHPDLGKDPQISGRFDREAQSASRLDHPNCLQVTDFGSTEAGMKFMVMQLLQGGELSSQLKQKLPSRTAAEMVLQILRGLEHAHENGVVHRDLKPENIFVTQDHDGKQILKLVDFGIAKILSGGADDGMTKAGIIFGTPRYMSPEQATGMDIDARTDLYSTGIILHQMLSGSVPFDGADAVTICRMQVTSAPPPLPLDVPAPLVGFTTRLLEKERDKRFSTAKEARLALEQLLLDLRESSSPDEAIDIRSAAADNAMNPTLLATEAGAGVKKFGSRWRLIAGVGALAFVAISLLLATGGRDDPTKASGTAGFAGLAAGGPSSDDLAGIDRLLFANDLEGARKLLQPLRDRYPHDAQLLWRQGRLFAGQRRRKAQALAAYGSALDENPDLLEDRDFYAELLALLEERALQEDAINLALRKMGRHGHKFLLALVNQPKQPLPYQDRHRVLDELARDPNNVALVNYPLNIGLDIEQAHQSLQPCTNYGRALQAIEARPDPVFIRPLANTGVPSPRRTEDEQYDEADAKACAPLPQRRERLLETLRNMEASAADGAAASEGVGADAPGSQEQANAEPVAGSAAAGSGKEGSTAGKKTSKQKTRKTSRCNVFGAALVYKECRR